MQKKLFFAALTTLSIFAAACGGKKHNHDNNVPIVTQPEAKPTNYEAFTKEKLQGNWKVTDAQAFSKDKMIGQTYSFVGDTATFFKNTGDAGMVTGTMAIDGATLRLSYSIKEASGSSSMTFKYEGGFFEEGKKLQLNAMDMQVTLQKQ